MATTAARATSGVDTVLLLHADPTDAVARTLLARAPQLGMAFAAVTLEQLVDEVEFGGCWHWRGMRIDPARCAVVNRLPLGEAFAPGDPAASGVGREVIGGRLRAELGRFRYASSLPTAGALIGCHGSLLDQWQDLPRLVAHAAAPVRIDVPAHSTAADPRPLHGRVFSVNRWALYQLGTPLHEAPAELPPENRLDYVRPDGWLVNLAQVGGTMFFANPPPTLTRAQEDAMIGFARALAAVSPIRIVEHTFFVGSGAPVLYASCPVPVASGGHPTYPDLVMQGLRDDIDRRARAGA